ncbi:o-succinylbenzoate synthase [Thermolongibacillus altinsuensis]|uniref:o-succinylbenzoate synthase n=1 Tax=Thermolongibacillus altinsuensis TaxID=575256 RepID=UPI00242A32A3|nr:o-succinylbenzoate synthase [Thermolongibacillus altinsuensis]GMB09899.1 o-succinylbenzoate synthase [Thermolongibacillus altinsuensis]
MNVKRVTLYHVVMRLRSPFVTSLETVQDRDVIIVEVEDADGVIGWGECVAFSTPWYTEETIKTCWHMLEDFLIPSILSATIEHPDQVSTLFEHVKRNHMAKASMEMAIWDLYAKRQRISLSKALGGVRTKIEVGVVVGTEKMSDCLKMIEAYMEQGYKRVKVKIKPENDYEWLKEIRRHFPEIPLMADANSAYSLKDVERLKALDEFQLMMIEQPLASDDLIEHAFLQKQIKTPICLDESIATYHDAKVALELGSCQVINIKIGRVGGLTAAKRIHDLCQKYHVAVWCGGMLETGISRAHNIALASLPHFTIPGDISASSRYWEKDIIIPEIIVNNGEVDVPDRFGIGIDVDRNTLAKKAVYRQIFE